MQKRELLEMKMIPFKINVYFVALVIGSFLKDSFPKALEPQRGNKD